ncbi:hypothetical protein GCM10025793_00430 [Lysobacter lycopersici]
MPSALAWRLRPVKPERRATTRWPLGAAFAAAAVLAIAIGLRPHAVGTPGATSAAATNNTIATTGDVALTAPLDRSPDFYAWLASPDAEQLAME